MSEEPWPWPGEDALTRARRVAQEYRSRLERLAPEVSQQVDALVSRFGETWAAGIEISDDPVLTTADAATYLAITPRGVRMAVVRGNLKPAGRDDEGYLFHRSDVMAYLAARDTRKVQGL